MYAIRSYYASVLIPQEESLFEYYSRFGYEPKALIFKKSVRKENPKDHFYSFRECADSDIDELNLLYENELKNFNYIKRDDNFWKNQLEMFRSLGGKVFCLEMDKGISGYAFCWNDDNKVVIQELLGQNNDIKSYNFV